MDFCMLSARLQGRLKINFLGLDLPVCVKYILLGKRPGDVSNLAL